MSMTTPIEPAAPARQHARRAVRPVAEPSGRGQHPLPSGGARSGDAAEHERHRGRRDADLSRDVVESRTPRRLTCTQKDHPSSLDSLPRRISYYCYFLKALQVGNPHFPTLHRKGQRCRSSSRSRSSALGWPVEATRRPTEWSTPSSGGAATGPAGRHRRRQPRTRRGRRAALRLRQGSAELGGRRRGPVDRRGEHRRRQRAAPPDRRGAGRRGQARAVREAAGRVDGGRPSHGGAGEVREGRDRRSATPTGGRRPSRRSATTSRTASWASSPPSTAATGATTPATRAAR